MRARLSTSLSLSDGRARNQDALEVVQDIFAELVKDRAEPIQNLHGYAAEVSSTKVKDYFRRTRRVHTALVDRLRYWLRHVPGYALWKEGNREFGGLAGWTGGRRAFAAGVTIASLRVSPLSIPKLPQRDLDLLDRGHWVLLLDAAFKELDGPVPFRDLVSIMACTLRLAEDTEEPIGPTEPDDEESPIIFEPPAPLTPADVLAGIRQILGKAWAEILELPPKQRQAYLLNPTDTELDEFVESSTASWAQISTAVELQDGHYSILWRELPLTAEEQGWAGSLKDESERFQLLRIYLPLEDLIIAKLLNCSRLQVIGLRKCARERLQRRLKEFR